MQVPFDTPFVLLPRNVLLYTIRPSDENDLLKPIRYAISVDDEGTIWKYIRCWKRNGRRTARHCGWVKTSLGNIRESR